MLLLYSHLSVFEKEYFFTVSIEFHFGAKFRNLSGERNDSSTTETVVLHPLSGTEDLHLVRDEV